MAVLSRAVLCVVALSLVISAGVQASIGNGNATGTVSVTLPSTDVCGKRGDRFKRIVGGFDAEPGMFPWIAAIGHKYEDSHTKMWCAGSLVTDRHLITAIFCLTGVNRLPLNLVRLGVLDLNDTESTRTEADYEVDTLTAHPGYDVIRSMTTNNIAIIKLKTRVTFSRFIRPICLPDLSEFRTENFTGSTGYIAGWGHTEFAGRSAKRLQQAQIREWDQEKCKKVYEHSKRAVIDNKVVCGVGDDGSDTCQGDGGGPLMMPYGPDSNYYLYGVTIAGKDCGDPHSPSVYTRVSEYMDWILPNLK